MRSLVLRVCRLDQASEESVANTCIRFCLGAEVAQVAVEDEGTTHVGQVQNYLCTAEQLLNQAVALESEPYMIPT